MMHLARKKPWVFTLLEILIGIILILLLPFILLFGAFVLLVAWIAEEGGVA